MMMPSIPINTTIVLLLLIGCYVKICSSYAGWLGSVPNTCDVSAALQCEYDFLKCKLFTGPAGDPATVCLCGEYYYGNCLRKAGCETAPQADPLSVKELYIKLCIADIIYNDCPNVLMCAMNCASDGIVNPNDVKILPINNYGETHLRVRICRRKMHQKKYDQYRVVFSSACEADEFEKCARWIPPHSFIPMAIPLNTTYLEIDSCEINVDGTSFCRETDPKPYRLYGNDLMFPRAYDSPQTTNSTCSTDKDCLGSYCATKHLSIEMRS
jgi:hypothetical protein